MNSEALPSAVGATGGRGTYLCYSERLEAPFVVL